MNRVKSLPKYILKSELLRSASVLAIGTLIAQAIPILLQPFLRRYFAPEEFGVYSVYSSVIGILMVVSSLRYEQTVILPKLDADSSIIVSLSIIISVTTSSLLFLFVVFFKYQIAIFLNIDESKAYIVLFIPLGTFLFSTFHVFNFWLIRKKAFLAISGNKLSRRIVEGFSQSAFALNSFSRGLVFGDILGQLVNVVAAFFQSLRKGFSFGYFSSRRAILLAKKYSEFPKYNLITSAMSASSNLLPVIFINRFFSAHQAGFFDLSKLMLSIPLALVATSFSSVILQRGSERFRANQSVVKDLMPILIITLIVAIAEIGIIILFGVDIFTLFFGETWRISGEISKLLVWPFAINFIASSFTSIFVALNRIKLQSLWQVLYFTAILSLTLFKSIGFIPFLRLYVAIEVLCNILLIGLLIFIVISYERSVKK